MSRSQFINKDTLHDAVALFEAAKVVVFGDMGTKKTKKPASRLPLLSIPANILVFS
jgi:hypothetical protein